MNRRLRDFLLYFSIGVAFVGGILLWVVYISPHYSVDAKWPTLAYFTVFLFGMVIRGYWHARKSLKFWLAFLILLGLHLLGYVLLLLQVERLPPISYLITFTPEMFLVGLLITYTTKIQPSVKKRGQSIRHTFDLRPESV